MIYQIENELPISEKEMSEIAPVWYYVHFANSDDYWVSRDRQRAENFQREETVAIEPPDIYGDWSTLRSVNFDADAEVIHETTLRVLMLSSEKSAP
jgi:hypothetical protein